MIANLPLLFAGGSPTSLTKMVMPELECFITFLVHCSWGHDTAKSIQQPQWWPPNVPFSDPFFRPNTIPNDWSTRLRDLIRQCYTYHNSEFLLKFSEELSRNPPSSLQYVDNCDRTTSLYQRSSGRLLVTFRNENMLYDRKTDGICRKSLLPKRQNPPESTMVEQVTLEIYLCDTCDQQFESLQDVKEHEKVCSTLRPSSPDILRLSPEPCERQEVQQDQFMQFLGLQNNSVNQTDSTPSNTNVTRNLNKYSRQRRSTVCSNSSSIPFSSMAGRKSNKGCFSSCDTQVRREHLDRYCPAPPLCLETPKWLNKAKPHFYPSKYKRTDNYWNRYQVFPEERNKIMLDLKSQLLYLDCKPLNVKVKRLTTQEIENCKQELKNSKTVRTVPRTKGIEHFKEELKNVKIARNARATVATSVQDPLENDIEFVSVSVCANLFPEKQRKRSFPLQLQPVKNMLSRNNVTIKSIKRLEIPKIDIIDLCSDDDDGVSSENANPFPVACHASSELLNPRISLAATPEFDHSMEPDSLEAAQYPLVKNKSHIGSQCVSSYDQKPNKTFPLKEFHVNLHSTQINTVILID